MSISVDVWVPLPHDSLRNALKYILWKCLLDVWINFCGHTKRLTLIYDNKTEWTHFTNNRRIEAMRTEMIVYSKQTATAPAVRAFSFKRCNDNRCRLPCHAYKPNKYAVLGSKCDRDERTRYLYGLVNKICMLSLWVQYDIFTHTQPHTRTILRATIEIIVSGHGLWWFRLESTDMCKHNNNSHKIQVIHAIICTLGRRVEKWSFICEAYMLRAAQKKVKKSA